MTTASRRPLVLTVGESMALFDPKMDGPFVEGGEFSLRVAGAESNFGIALGRLGCAVRWISRLGSDALGDMIHTTLEGEGLDLDFVRRTSSPTGLFLKWRSQGRSHVVYYRGGSAASTMDASDVPDSAMDGVALVHLTGITMALSESARATVLDVARRARRRSIPVLFDPNFRPQLWEHPADAARTQAEVLPFVDWYLCGEEEGNLLWGTADARALLDAVSNSGIDHAVVRVGAEGAIVRDSDSIIRIAPDRLEQVLDEVGAGDGFAAGFAYGLLNGWDAEAAAKVGNLLAARALLGTGDWETFPHLAEVRDSLHTIGANGKGVER
jgi:2-dehydro-3-deoxygluconokinase